MKKEGCFFFGRWAPPARTAAAKPRTPKNQTLTQSLHPLHPQGQAVDRIRRMGQTSALGAGKSAEEIRKTQLNR